MKNVPAPALSSPILKRCCARATNGNAAAPPSAAMNARRLIHPSPKDRQGQHHSTTEYPASRGGENLDLSECAAAIRDGRDTQAPATRSPEQLEFQMVSAKLVARR